jgi:opacity protein-like surface antigen
VSRSLGLYVAPLAVAGDSPAEEELEVIKGLIGFAIIGLLIPCAAHAQGRNMNPQGSAQLTQASQQQSSAAAGNQTQGAVERAVRRYRIGVTGGVAFDPELIDFGAHAAFGPFFRPNVEVRPGIEFGLGEITTLFGINVDVLYSFPAGTSEARWMPYIGGGPNFALSHEDLDFTDDDDGNRFDFSDTDFNSGFNFVAGARNPRGLFFELKATAWGVSNVRLLAGFNF